MNKTTIVFIWGILILVIYLRFWFFFGLQTKYNGGEYISFKTTLFSDPKVSATGQNFSASLANGKVVFINTTVYPEYKYGDSLLISGNLQKRVLNDKRIIFTLNYPQIEPVKNNLSGFLAVTSFVRQKVISIFTSVLPAKPAALLLGIVFGIRESMPKDYLQALTAVGVLHIIAASGMNVTLVAGFLSSILVLFLKRQQALLLSIFGVVFYAFMAGLGPSIVRATIMGILVFSARILGRQSLAVNSLLLAGYGMLIISPNLLFDIGFQLSFAATAGLLFLPNLFQKLSIVRKHASSEVLVVSFSAQIATLPILTANFGTVSLWSVVVNGLVLWTVPVLTILGSIAAIFSFVFEPLARLFLYLCLPFLLYFEKIVIFFTGFGGVLMVENVNLQLIMGYYLIIVALVYFFLKNTKS